MQLVNRLKSLFFDDIWIVEPEQPTRLRRLFFRQLKFLYIVASRFNDNQIKLQALALSFKMVTSIVPLLAVTFSVLKAFGVQNRARPVLEQALAPLGPQGAEITDRLLEFVNNMNVGALGSVGLITLFFTVVSLIGNVEAAFNQIWGCKSGRTLTRKLSDYLSALLVGPVLIFSAIAVTASLQSHTLVKTLISLEPFGFLILFLLRLLPYVTVWAAFTFLYLFIPNTRVRLASASIGALVAAVVWQTIGWGFTAFVASSTKYYAVYSSFAVLLLFLFWIYVEWMIVLFGASVAFAHQNFHIYEHEKRPNAVSPAAKEGLALRLMTAVGDSFYRSNARWTAAELARHLRVPHSLADEVLSFLKERKLLVDAQDGTVLPARDLERIGIKEIIDAVRNHGDTERSVLADTKTMDPAARVLRELDDAVAATLGGKTLKSLVSPEEEKDKITRG